MKHNQTTNKNKHNNKLIKIIIKKQKHNKGLAVSRGSPSSPPLAYGRRGRRPSSVRGRLQQVRARDPVVVKHINYYYCLVILKLRGSLFTYIYIIFNFKPMVLLIYKFAQFCVG